MYKCGQEQTKQQWWGTTKMFKPTPHKAANQTTKTNQNVQQPIKGRENVQNTTNMQHNTTNNNTKSSLPTMLTGNNQSTVTQGSSSLSSFCVVIHSPPSPLLGWGCRVIPEYNPVKECPATTCLLLPSSFPPLLTKFNGRLE